ncbi:MAG: SpoIID/LytB domain-containing protein [Chitinophagaceae bacterium]|nr:SpoIID/LytB domain-containing protein [Oligoflexus sp.]
MKSLNSNVLMMLLALMSLPVRASDTFETNKYMLDMVSAGVSSRTLMRVKVFPHDKDYKPQGLDTKRDQFSVSSDGVCQLLPAAHDKVQATGPVSQKFSKITFTAATLGSAVIIRCAQPFKLERAGVSSLNSYSYSGSLYVRAVAGELEAINLIDLKNYLRGVVPSEVYRDWPIETLKTQAVAARTYAVYHLIYARRFSSDRLWDVDDTINFQAYTGTSLISDKTDSAITNTEGQILTFRGNVIQAFYHADSGGQTEDALSVWSQAIPFTVARPEAPEVEVAKNVWERTFSLATLEQELRATGYLDAGKSLRSIVIPIVGRSPSGRVKSMALIDSAGQHKAFPLNVFRKVAGQLPSPLFYIEKDPKAVRTMVIKGVGFGHGVGMSQQGAAALAGQKAWDYKQILSYYYLNTTLCSLDTANESIPDCKSQRVAQAQATR